MEDEPADWTEEETSSDEEPFGEECMCKEAPIQNRPLPKRLPAINYIRGVTMFCPRRDVDMVLSSTSDMLRFCKTYMTDTNDYAFLLMQGWLFKCSVVLAGGVGRRRTTLGCLF